MTDETLMELALREYTREYTNDKMAIQFPWLLKMTPEEESEFERYITDKHSHRRPEYLIYNNVLVDKIAITVRYEEILQNIESKKLFNKVRYNGR